jgi:hypothetical protein
VDGVAEILGRSDITSLRIPYAQLRAELEAAAGPAGWNELRQLTWKPMAMRKKWRGEHLPGWRKNPVIHLVPHELARYRLTIDAKGLIRDVNGKLFSCAAKSYFAVDPDGNWYGRDEGELLRIETKAGRKDGKTPVFKHSSFFAGGDALMPFEGKVADGQALELRNRSGHYHPGRRKFVAFLLQNEHRLDLSKAVIEFDERSPVDEEIEVERAR